MDKDIIDYLTGVASKIRTALDKNKLHTIDAAFKNFPVGACGVTSELVARFFREHHNLEAFYVCGERDDGHTHAWVEIEDIIIDLTADQFNQLSIIVTRDRTWHSQWNQEELRRDPIVSLNQWPSYPLAMWLRIVKECS